jgi:hypothetical protein
VADEWITKDSIEAEFPGWEAFQGVDRRWHARVRALTSQCWSTMTPSSACGRRSSVRSARWRMRPTSRPGDDGHVLGLKIAAVFY